MVPCTRSGSLKDFEETDEDEDLCEELDTKDSEVTKKSIHQDMSFYRKFLIAKDDLKERNLYMLRHPRSSTGTLYALGDEIVEEVLRINDPHRSFFYGDSVIADGSITMLCAIHPLFLVIPYLLKNAKDRFVPLDDILVDEDYPAIAMLCENRKLLKALSLVCNNKCIYETEVWQYSETLLLKWLEDRFERLKNSLLENATLHKAIRESDVVLRRYTYSVLCDYIPQDLFRLLKAHLHIQDPEPLKEKQINSLKRKLEDSGEVESYFNPNVAEKPKSVTLTSNQKKLQAASKGTKSLLGFFGGKK